MNNALMTLDGLSHTAPRMITGFPKSNAFGQRMRKWARRWLPSITSASNAMQDLADGYALMARRCRARGDAAAERYCQLCAEAIGENSGLRQMQRARIVSGASDANRTNFA